MNNRFYDVEYKKDAEGEISLTQQCGVDEPNVVLMRPEQLLFIARQLCGMKPETAGKVAELERRIAVMVDKLQNIVCDSAFRSDLIEDLSDGFAYLAKLDGLLDLAMEFDGGRLRPQYEDDEPTVCASSASKTPGPVSIAEAVKTQPRAIAKVTGADNDKFTLSIQEQ